MPYKCTVCGHIQQTNGPCTGFNHPGGWSDSMMKLANQNQRMAANMNIGIYGDGGCLGCNRKKRRIGAFVIAVIAFIVAGVLALLDYDAYQQHCVTAIGIGVICAAAGICCPDGCCGEYRRRQNYYRVWFFDRSFYNFLLFFSINSIPFLIYHMNWLN